MACEVCRCLPILAGVNTKVSLENTNQLSKLFILERQLCPLTSVFKHVFLIILFFMRKIVGKVGSNILAFASHFADLTLALCPLGWGLTRCFFFLLANTIFTIVSIKPYAICGFTFKRHGQN